MRNLAFPCGEELRKFAFGRIRGCRNLASRVVEAVQSCLLEVRGCCAILHSRLVGTVQICSRGPGASAQFHPLQPNDLYQ
jgi:hypothetical protein